MARYFSLLTMTEAGLWAPQFGDYDRDVVADEREDSYADEKSIIISTKDDQASIDKKVAEMNAALEEVRKAREVVESAIDELLTNPDITLCAQGDDYLDDQPSRDKVEIMSNLFQCDQEVLVIRERGERQGYLIFVPYCGADVLADGNLWAFNQIPDTLKKFTDWQGEEGEE